MHVRPWTWASKGLTAPETRRLWTFETLSSAYNVDVTDEAFSADDFELIEGQFTFKIDEVAPYVRGAGRRARARLWRAR